MKSKFTKVTAFMAVLLCFSTAAWAQSMSVHGTVKGSDDGFTLPGVNVVIEGSAIGTSTDFDGNYAIEANKGDVLLFSFMGYTTARIVVEQEEINVDLLPDSEQLDEVVVTALGIKREKKALGYAVAEVGDEAFENAKAPNVMSSLSGRLSGVQVSSTGQGPASSSSVIIRGNASLSGSNEPLYVVDGVPMSNNQLSNADDKDNGGIDSGNGMSAIPADDIENVSVLKGPAATALYGSRAMNGVVMITTKSGKGNKGTTVDFTSATTFEKARLYNNWQDEYGQGNYGQAPTTELDARENTGMWGAPYSSTPNYVDYKGNTSPYQFHNNEADFYDTGVTFSNSVAVNHNTEKSTLRMSYSNLTNEGMVPGTDYDRNTITLNGMTKALNDKVELRAKVAYSNEESSNQMMGATPFNPTSDLMGVPSNVPLSDLKDYKDPVTGAPIGFGNKNFNPYWTINEIDHNYRKDRIMSMGQVKIDLAPGLTMQGRIGNDYAMYNSTSLFPIGTPYYETGRATTQRNIDSETNVDGMISYNKDWEDWGMTVNVGGSMMIQEFDGLNTFDEAFTDPQLQGPGHGNINTHSVNYHKKRINSAFGTAQMRYKNLWYVDISARNDWSSTLPLDNNSYFYPSFSTSLIFTELFDQPEWFTFGKVRASWAEVGSDTDPYSLALTYSIDKNLHPGNGGSAPVGNIGGGTIPNNELKPSRMSSYEFGVDLKFFENRLGVDVGYYNNLAIDQIINVGVSGTSGYSNAIVNAGSIRNSGWELSLYATPIENKNFTWNTSVNFATNNNEVVELADGVSHVDLYNSNSVQVRAVEGEQYGQIMGTVYKRDTNGDIVLNENGHPVKEDGLHAIGNAYHNMMLGWVNSFSYKNWTATIVFDGKFGGDIYSSTEAAAVASGKHQTTLARSGYVPGEVWYPAELNGQGTTAKPQEFYGAVADINEQFIYDASYISLQEISITYAMPSKLFENNKYFRGASLGFFARNIGYIWRATDNVDPQASFSIANGGGGVEMGNMALPASYGLNLNIKF